MQMETLHNLFLNKNWCSNFGEIYEFWLNLHLKPKIFLNFPNIFVQFFFSPTKILKNYIFSHHSSIISYCATTKNCNN